MRKRRYIADDDRIRISLASAGEFEVFFSRRARGVPFSAHGGAIGAAFIALAGPRVRSFYVKYQMKTKIEENVTIKFLGEDSAEMWRQNGETKLSVVRFERGELPVVCSNIWKASDVLKGFEEVLLENVDVPDFQLARRIQDEEEKIEGLSHFDFHVEPRMQFLSWRKDSFIFSILFISPEACDDVDQGDNALVSKGALFVALDESMGACVNLLFPQSLVTGDLKADFFRDARFEQVGKKDLYCPVTLASKCSAVKAAGSNRRVLSKCELFFLKDSTFQGLFDDDSRLVARGESTFVLLNSPL